ncbi:hypothetical protein [Methylocystis sp. JR02]|uniref:hypothetical protein n=1 Tax=Methylocystis sp. JR02 TaxID=3046284 RepID=UPI0024BA9DA5|nr:hypothetical protein [Methylocystis sp. JR02]MDJ0449229.1 hypothetical protein [Methylocystis sp. JR02]
MIKALVIAVFLAFLGSAAFGQQAQLSPDGAAKAEADAAANRLIKKCAGGMSEVVEVGVKGELTKFFRQAMVAGKVEIRDTGAIIDKIKPDEVGAKFYEIYTRCIKDIEIELKKLDIQILDKLGNLEDFSSTLPLNFPKSPFEANMFVRKIKVGRSYDTVVKLRDATCNVNVWAAMWAFPPDRAEEPSLLIAMTNSGHAVTSYPFEFHFDRDSNAVSDAEYATHDEYKGAVDEAEFNRYVASNPDEIYIYIVFRAMGTANFGGCSGVYSIAYVPKGTRQLMSPKKEPTKLAGELYGKLISALDELKSQFGPDPFDGSVNNIAEKWEYCINKNGFPRTKKDREDTINELYKIGLKRSSAFIIEYMPASSDKIKYLLDDLKLISLVSP